MSSRFNFAPVSSAQSSLLRFASGYFLLNGLLYGLLVAVAALRVVLGWYGFAPTVLNIVGLFIGVITAVGLVWTGGLLGRGSRLGGFLALGFLLLPIAFGLLSPLPSTTTDIVFGVLGLLVVAIVWRELK
jgi:hypothetical protein